MPDPAAPPQGRLRRVFVSAGVALGLLALKLKGLLLLFFAKARLLVVNPFEGFGAAQFAWAGGSMALSIVAYAFKLGLPFAVGFVLLTVIHEVGHAIVIRAKGLLAGAMVFIPFVGGAVTLRDQPRSAFDDAQIGLAGPIAGTLGAILCLLVYELSGTHLFLVLAFAGFLLNLINMTPIGPFDGGRIAGAVTKWTWVLGGAVLVWICVMWKSPLLVVVILLSVFQIHRAIQMEKGNAFYDASLSQRMVIAMVYFLLLLFLGYFTASTHGSLTALMDLD